MLNCSIQQVCCILTKRGFMFITFEGCEGVGKSTQIKFLEEYLKDTNQDALFLREPGGTIISEKIRNIILDINNKELSAEAEALLYASSRAQLLREKIIPALENNRLVFCDRYIDSSIAYQAYARNLGVGFVKKINSFALSYMPDYTVFIDLPPQNSFRTVKTIDRLEQENLNFHMNVYKGFCEIGKDDPKRFIFIKPSDDKHETSKNIIDELIKRKVIK